jgi:hypothetical protein
MAESVSPFLSEEAKARFWAKVDKRGPDECWPWMASFNTKGYGRFCVYDRHITRAHRVAWALHHGEPVLPGTFICHSCDNRACCNPAHLWRGDNAANMLDMAQKGRGWRQKRTHCDNGHEYTPENTAPRKGAVGARDCRICRRARNKAAGMKRRRPTGLG